MADPPISELTPQQRTSQVAAILAIGVERFERCRRRSESPEKELPEFSSNCLEVSGHLRLTGSQSLGG